MVLIYVLKLSNEPVQGLSTVKLLPGNVFLSVWELNGVEYI